MCQDFTNLFICLARLLGVPARYVCGYVYTGPKSAELLPHQRQGEASHAWVQLYLPQVGWKGFDPTNGILTQTDHVRDRGRSQLPRRHADQRHDLRRRRWRDPVGRGPASSRTRSVRLAIATDRPVRLPRPRRTAFITNN